MTAPRSLAALLLGAAVSACAPLAPPASSAPPPAGGKSAAAASEPTARFIGFVGPKAQHDPPFLGISDTNFYCLRSFLDRQTGETAHQLYVADSYFGAKRGWEAARDAAGTDLPLTAISNNEIACDDGCSYAEEFAATLPEAALRA